MTYISTHLIIIKTDTNLLFFMNIFIYRTRRNWWSQQSTTVTWVMVGRVAGMRPISTSPFNINSCYTISRGRVAGILRPRFKYTDITTMISYDITRGRVAGIKIHMPMTIAITIWIVDGIKIPMSMYFITQRHFKNFFGNFIFRTTVGGIMSGLMRPIS